jgi:CheY-like chemotaxis protein
VSGVDRIRRMPMTDCYGRAASQRAQTSRPERILMDIVISELDGLEATRHLRQHPSPKGGTDHRDRGKGTAVFAELDQNCQDYVPPCKQLVRALARQIAGIRISAGFRFFLGGCHVDM